jgi:SAM-dependent methyltransferase
LEDAPLDPNSFDVITMFGVLEHLHDPRGALRHAHRLLKPDGVLAVYVPNFQYLRLKDAGLVARLRTGRWSDLHPQEHMFQFTPRSLRQMLENTRFACLHVDIGSPFLNCRGVRRAVKLAAYYLACGMKRCVGVHLGGIEAVARRSAGDEVEMIARRAAA